MAEWNQHLQKMSKSQEFDSSLELKRTIPQTILVLSKHNDLIKRDQRFIFEVAAMPDDLYVKRIRFFLDPFDKLKLLKSRVVVKKSEDIPGDGFKKLKLIQR